jgi:hypothetical protein
MSASDLDSTPALYAKNIPPAADPTQETVGWRYIEPSETTSQLPNFGPGTLCSGNLFTRHFARQNEIF